MDRVPPDKLSSLPSEYVRVNYKVNGIRIQYPGRGNDAQRLIEEIQMVCKKIRLRPVKFAVQQTMIGRVRTIF